MLASNLKKVSLAGGGYSWINTIVDPAGGSYSLKTLDSFQVTNEMASDSEAVYPAFRTQYTNADPTSYYAAFARFLNDGTLSFGRAVGTNSNSCTNGGFGYSGLSVNGSKILAAGKMDDYGIEYLFSEYTTGGVTTGIKYSNSYSSTDYTNCAISPDGSKFAFCAKGSLFYPKIWVLNSSGYSGVSALTGGASTDTPISTKWVSNTELVVISQGANYRIKIMKYNVTTGSFTYKYSYNNSNNSFAGFTKVAYSDNHVFLHFQARPGTPIADDAVSTVMKVNLATGNIVWVKYVKRSTNYSAYGQRIAVDKDTEEVYLIGYDYGLSKDFLMGLSADGSTAQAYYANNYLLWGFSFNSLCVNSTEKQIYCLGELGTSLKMFSVPTDLSAMTSAETGYEWSELTGMVTYDNSIVQYPITRSTDTFSWSFGSSDHPTLNNFSSWNYPAYRNVASSNFKEVTI